ncbi:MAG: endonuclease Q family protein, partial [Deltaproteobacteria bacterium]|nr:endonuclease Q family protein [Deltaproteobacteria bacterium]
MSLAKIKTPFKPTPTSQDNYGRRLSAIREFAFHHRSYSSCSIKEKSATASSRYITPAHRVWGRNVMNRFFADLHIHSRYSRATSSSLTVHSLDAWATHKGIQLLGTGDLTHPSWLSELEENLKPTDNGLYQLLPNRTYFVPTGEISAIYKQDGRTRKIHLLIIAPDLSAAKRFSKALGQIGNISSDGRPI